MKRLSPGVKYTVRVMAINCIGESPFSPLATFSTQATVPAAPGSLSVCSSGQDSVVLQWEAVAGNGADVSGYQVMMDDGQGGDFNFVGHTQQPQFAIAGLRSGLSYRFRVQAENSEGLSQWSPVCLAQTAATAPLAPPPPFKEASTHSSITITWRPPEYDGGSQLLGYEIEMQPKSDIAKQDVEGSGWMRVYQGKETTHTLGSLRAGCTYKVRVRAVNSIGAGAFSFPADVATSPASPEAPGAPAAGNRAQHALTVLWDGPQHDGGSPILSYRLGYRVVGPVEEQKLTSNGDAATTATLKTSAADDDENAAVFRVAYDGAERKAEIQGLDPGMKYEFRVNASNKQGTSSWSSTAVLSTKPGLPLSPAAPAITHGSAPRSLELTWVKPYGQGAPVDSYIVQMKMAEKVVEEEQQQIQFGSYTAATANGNGNGVHHDSAPASERSSSSVLDDASFTTVYHSSETHCTVTDLEPNCEYLFRMRAFNPVGASPWSAIASAHTAAAAPSCPQTLHSSHASEASLTFKWEAPAFDYGAAVTVYQLEVASASRSGGQRASDKASWRSVYKGSTMQYNLEDLQPGQQYCARVRAQNSCGWGPWSEVLTSATLAAVPGAPEAPLASGRTGSSVRLSWSPPSETNGSSVTEYELQMAESSQLQWSTLVNGVDTNWKVSDLLPGTSYSFRVRASNAVGFGPWSPLTVVETALMPPLEPQNVEINTATAGEEEAEGVVSIKWAPPTTAEQRASCTGYEIECTSAAGSGAGAHKSGGAHKGGAKSSAANTVVKHTCSSKATEFKLTTLKEGKWTVRLRAIGADGAGHGGWSPAATVHIVEHVVLHHGNASSDSMAAAAAGGTALGAAMANGGGGGKWQRKQKRRSSIDQKDTASVGSGHSDDSHSMKGGHPRGQALGTLTTLIFVFKINFFLISSSAYFTFFLCPGTKTAVAKAKPRPKTLLYTFAKALGTTESAFKSLLWTVFALMVVVAVLMSYFG